MVIVSLAGNELTSVKPALNATFFIVAIEKAVPMAFCQVMRDFKVIITPSYLGWIERLGDWETVKSGHGETELSLASDRSRGLAGVGRHLCKVVRAVEL